MFPNNDQISNAAKANFDQQIAAVTELTETEEHHDLLRVEEQRST